MSGARSAAHLSAAQSYSAEGPVNSEKTFYKSKSTVITHFYSGVPIKIFYLDDQKTVQNVTLGHDHQLHYAVKPGTWFSRFLDSDSKSDIDLENSPYRSS